MPNSKPPLKPLHSDDSLIVSKLKKYAKLSNQELVDSLKPGQQGSLKVRPDGTIVDGHHRIKILRDRGVDVDSLPREIIPKDTIPDPPYGTVIPDETEHVVLTELYWIEGVWPGRLAIMPRPRGGDWLEDELQSWRRSGVDGVVSLLTREEQSELNLADEEKLSRANGIEFVSFPIVDRGIPASFEDFSEQMLKFSERLANGKTIAVHCRQGIGRAALVAICLLSMSGVEPTAAIERVRTARGRGVPETPEQFRWIADFAKSLAVAVPK